jgi:succinate-semialdehyde dehydrogenase/glutarate-semialdehyde dehydrogenase
VFRFAAPGLMAGNAAVLKHASNVSGCALAIEEIMTGAGLPRALFRTLLVGSDRVGGLIEAPEVVAVTLTGSAPAGRAVAAKAGSLLKKTVLELGGSDPYLVLADADLEPTVEACVNSRLINSGQSCIAAKRFIVVKSRRKVFEEAVTEKMKSKTFGDPIREPSDLGPMARADLRDALHDQVTRSIEMGARALCGAALPYRKGYFYPPTVLTGVTKGMPAFDKETFGPVAAIVPADDDEHAITLANDTPFGLGAAIFSKDVDRAERIAREHLNAGSCFVNAYVKSDPRLPFGGIKSSGYGRELGLFGIREFVNTKTVYCR